MSKLEATSMTKLAGARMNVSKRSRTSGCGMKRSSSAGDTVNARQDHMEGCVARRLPWRKALTLLLTGTDTASLGALEGVGLCLSGEMFADDAGRGTALTVNKVRPDGRHRCHGRTGARRRLLLGDSLTAAARKQRQGSQHSECDRACKSCCDP